MCSRTHSVVHIRRTRLVKEDQKVDVHDSTATATAGGAPDFNPMTSPHREDPHLFYEWARAEQPVCYSETLGAWMVTRYDDLMTPWCTIRTRIRRRTRCPRSGTTRQRWCASWRAASPRD